MIKHAKSNKMEQFIIEYAESTIGWYIKINNESDLLIIYDLLKNNIIVDNHTSMTSFYYDGCYYKNTKIDYNLMKKYYLISINYGNIDAMRYLGNYYSCVEKNDVLTKKYHFMAIKHGCVSCAINYCKTYIVRSQENINDALCFYNMLYGTKNPVNALSSGLSKPIAIKIAFDNNYTVDNKHITDYMQSMKISILLSKYNNICVNIKQVFMNYEQIMMFLWITGRLVNGIPKHVKLNIISLLV